VKGVSLILSVFNLTNTAIGAGVLSLPFFFASTGVVIGVCILFVVASMSAFSLALLVDCNMLGQVCYYIFQSIFSLCSV
jgi:amino acid permease